MNEITHQDFLIENWYEVNKKSYTQQIQSLQQKLRSAIILIELYQSTNKFFDKELVILINQDISRFSEAMKLIDLHGKIHSDKKQKELDIIHIVLQYDLLSIINELEDLLTYITALSKNQQMCNELELFTVQRFDLQITPSEFRYCCNIKMKIEIKQSELICTICGKTQKYSELVFEKNTCLSTEKGRTKSNKYKPMRNFNKWMEKITCKDEQVDQAILEKILQKFQRDYKDFERGKYDVSIRTIRKCLKSLGLSQYNTHTAYIRQYLTLQDPPQFTGSEIKRIAEYYSQVIHLYSRMSDKYNISYCPNIIAKIVENIFDDPEKQKIKQFIHFQNINTAQKFDAVWKKICSQLPGFIYTPTSFDY